MKKYRLFCVLLCLVLFMNSACPVAFAEGDTDEQTAGSVTEPADLTAPEPTTPGFSSMAGENGCAGFDARKALGTSDKLLSTAKSAILYDYGSNSLLYGWNADARVYPASLAKIMTCLLILENAGMDDEITITDAAFSGLPYDASVTGLMVGEELTVGELLYCMMVSSGNEAATMAAEYVAGSQEAFVEMMNDRAKKLGCANTHFTNVHGLHDEDQYTTVRDLARIIAEAVQNEDFVKIFGTTYHEVPETNMSEMRVLRTSNYLMSGVIVDNFYDKRVTGGKIGITDAAGRCIAFTAKSGSLKMIGIVMGAEAVMRKNGYSYEYFGNMEEAVILLNYGFDHFSSRQILSEGQTIAQFPVSGGENDIVAGVKDTVYSAIPLNAEVDDLRWQTNLYNGGLTAPIEKGEAIGTLQVWSGNVCLAEAELIAMSGCKKAANVLQGDAAENTVGESPFDFSGILMGLGIVFLAILVLGGAAFLYFRIQAALLQARRNRRRRDRRRSK